MKKNSTGIVVLLAVVILLVSFIFMNSLKNAEASMHDSNFVVRIIAPIVKKIFGRVPDNIGYIVRKLAHLAEFAMLGVSALAFADSLKGRIKRDVYGYTCFGVLLIAVTDEFIQMFSGRGSSVYDVLIDLCGAIFGFLIYFIINALISLFKNNKAEKE